MTTRGGVLEDVFGLEDVLEDTFWSPWPWPRSLKSSKIALLSARGQHSFLTGWNFIDWLKNVFPDRFIWRLTEKKFLRSFFLGKHLHLCPWSLALASSIPVLSLGLGFFCVLGIDLGLKPCVLDSTSGDYNINYRAKLLKLGSRLGANKGP